MIFVRFLERVGGGESPMEILRTYINAPGHRSAGVKSREVEKKTLQGGE